MTSELNMAKLYLEEYYSPFSKHNRETCFWYVTIVNNKAYVKLQGNYQSDGNEQPGNPGGLFLSLSHSVKHYVDNSLFISITRL